MISLSERYLIDPPGGHAHGFPKRFTGDPETLEVNEWLVRNGYPQNEVDLFRDRAEVPVRIIGPFGANDPEWLAYE